MPNKPQPLSPAGAPPPWDAPWWRHLFDAAVEAQMVCDRWGAVQAVNRAAESWIGLQVGMNLWTATIFSAATGERLSRFIETAPPLPAREFPVRMAPLGQPAVESVVRLTALEAGGFLIALRPLKIEPTPAQLYRAQRMSTVGSLTSAVTHEFNNQLMAVRGCLGLALMMEDLDQRVRTRLTQADSAADRAGALSQQLQGYARLLEAEVSCQDLNEIVRRAAEHARRILRGKYAVDLQLSSEPLAVEVDLARTEQIVINLILNAGDAMPGGGAIILGSGAVPSESIAGWAARETATRPFAHLSVRDQGVGISPDDSARVFAPFFTSKPPGKSLGLGLSVARDLAADDGGFLTMDSELGRGTKANLYLPLAVMPRF